MAFVLYVAKSKSGAKNQSDTTLSDPTKWYRGKQEEQEWRTALKEKGLDAIEPQPLVPSQEAPPPEELKDLHFNDAYMLIRKAIEHGSTSG